MGHWGLWMHWCSKWIRLATTVQNALSSSTQIQQAVSHMTQRVSGMRSVFHLAQDDAQRIADSASELGQHRGYVKGRSQ